MLDIRRLAAIGIVVILSAALVLVATAGQVGSDSKQATAIALEGGHDGHTTANAAVGQQLPDHLYSPMAQVSSSTISPSTSDEGTNATSPSTSVVDSTTLTSGTPISGTTATTLVGSIVAGELSLTNPVIEAGTTLVFDATKNVTLRVRGSMTVLGTLVMRPNSEVIHRIVFEDRGELLVTAGGVLDIQGMSRVAWNRTGVDPSWDVDDELIVAPIAPGDWDYHPFTMGSSVPTYQGYDAEVANLTRNVVIDNPSRVMLMGLDGHAPQVIRYATIANAGVRDVLGMYALHFHLNGDATRGSIVEGVVIRDSQYRAFVPHGSNGITFRDTLAVNVVANGYWWDRNLASDPPDPVNESHDIVYERAGVIGLSTSNPDDQGLRQSGFNLGDGSGNVVRDSFVAGLRSGPDHSGFFWPGGADGVWSAQNLISHNNQGHGFFVWQNNAEAHMITGIDAYLNGGAGISQGAYKNSYHWVDATLVANGEGLHLHTFSQTAPRPRQTFECLTITDSPLGVVVDPSPAPKGGEPTLFTNLVMQRVGEEFRVTDRSLAAGQTLEARVELVAYQTPC